MGYQSGDEEDDNFVICTDEEYMSGGYIGNSEWENLPPAPERLNKKIIAAHATAMRCAEEDLDGQKNKADILQGPYCVGGLAVRSIRQHKQQAHKRLETGELDESGYQRQLRHINTTGKRWDRRVQLTLSFGAKRKEPPSDLKEEPPTQKKKIFHAIATSDDDLINIAPITTTPLPFTLAPVTIEDCTSISNYELNEEHVQTEEMAALLNTEDRIREAIIVEEVEEMDDVMAEEVPNRSPQELQEAAKALLMKSRKSKNYHGEQMYAALVDFYRWQTRMGRIASSLRVARNCGRGKSFAQVICKQACHFEGHDAITQTHQGRRAHGTGLLNDEDFYMNVQ